MLYGFPRKARNAEAKKRKVIVPTIEEAKKGSDTRQAESAAPAKISRIESMSQITNAKKAATKIKRLVALRKIQKAEVEALEAGLKEMRLEEMKAIHLEPDQIAVDAVAAQINLGELRDLHRREMLALNILLERKREMQLEGLEKSFDGRVEELQAEMEQADPSTLETKRAELQALESERAFARKQLEEALGRYEEQVLSAENDRLLSAETPVEPQGMRDELDRLKLDHEVKWRELNSDLEAERLRRREALLARLERKRTRLRGGSASEGQIEALEVETQRQLASLDLEVRGPVQRWFGCRYESARA